MFFLFLVFLFGKILPLESFVEFNWVNKILQKIYFIFGADVEKFGTLYYIFCEGYPYQQVHLPKVMRNFINLFLSISIPVIWINSKDRKTLIWLESKLSATKEKWKTVTIAVKSIQKVIVGR